MRSIVLAVAGVLLLAAPAAADPPNLNLPPVKMQRVVVAAQTDFVRPAGTTTPGARASVKRVQRALRAKGYKSVTVDGRFGTETMGAYSKWQASTGGSGVTANGIPGRASLKALGTSRFIVTDPIKLGNTDDRYGTERVSTRTRRMLEAAAARLGPGCEWPIVQGSYSTSVGESLETHAGGGAADLPGTSFCGKGREKARKALVAVGFAAWYRDADEGFPPPDEHIHVVANGDPEVSTPIYPGGFTAWAQLGGWALGGKGLTTPSPGPIKREPKLWETYTP